MMPVLAQGSAQGGLEPGRVAPHLALVHQAALRLVHKLDGVLDGQDVVAPVLVGVVDNGGQRGGLAAAGGAGDEHEALVQHGQVAQALGQAQLLHGQDLLRNLAEHGGDAPVLHEEVDAVAGHAGQLVGEVHVAGLLEMLDLGLGRDLVEHGLELFVLQHLVLDARELAAQAQQRLGAAGQVQIAAAVFVEHVEEGIDLCHAVPGLRLRAFRARGAGDGKAGENLSVPCGGLYGGTAETQRGKYAEQAARARARSCWRG